MKGRFALAAGVNTTLTEATVQAGYTESEFIRWRDGVPEKIGGWQLYYPFDTSAVVRNLHPWKDIAEVSRLALGSVDQLAVINSGLLTDITPLERIADVAVNFSTTNGSALVTINDAGANMTTNDVVQIQTPVSIGGLILQGVYRITTVLSADSYTITAASEATSTVTGGGDLPVFDTTNGAATVLVTLPAHGYAVADSVSFLAPTTVGGVTIQGLYQILAVPSIDTFVIAVPTVATATVSGTMNGGDARLYYFVTEGPAPAGAGFGTSGYGEGGYGTGVAYSGGNGTPISSTDWSLDNWGSILVASPTGGAIYTWSGESNLAIATVIPEAPTACKGFFVAAPQQQIMVYGASVLGVQDPLLIAWCDVGDFSVWSARTTNQAGTRRLPRGSEIRGGRQTAQQILIWTDLELWSVQYIGPPDVYGFNSIAEKCGLISEYAHAEMNGVVFWMGINNFYMLAGGGVQVVPCPVYDKVFKNLNSNFVENIRVGTNSAFNEFVVYYPSAGSASGENDSYVKWNPLQNAWDYGRMGRSAWVDQSVLGKPIGASGTAIYQHEIGFDDDGAVIESGFTTGYLMLEEGGKKVFVERVWPDFKWNTEDGSATDAEMQITFFVRDYPEDTPAVYGPFDVDKNTGYITPRFGGRLAAMRVRSTNTGSFWRLGNMRYVFSELEGK